MSVLNIQDVKRQGTRVVIAFAGQSGTGKTYTALLFACGLAGGDPQKVGFLDTENGRGRLYADIFDKPFLYGQLEPPFTPERYIQAIQEFVQTGVEVLVIDSVSHEYEGIGGILDLHAKLGKEDRGWTITKDKHKRFVNRMLQAPMHIVVCVRAREKTDFSNPKKPMPMGIQPIQETNFMYEMTASVLMKDEGKTQRPIKCPEDLRGVLGREKGYITQKDGEAIRLWVNEGEPVDPAVDQWLGELRLATEEGTQALREVWAKVPSPVRKKLGGKCPEDLKSAAADYDRIEAERNAGGELSEAASQFASDAEEHEDVGEKEKEPE